MKTLGNKKRNHIKMSRNQTGLRHSEIIPWHDGYTCTYCYHGSTMIVSKDFPDLESAQEFQLELRK